MRTDSSTRAALALGAVTLAAAVLRLHGVSSQPLEADELWAGATALHYVQSGQFWPTMWFHPNLRNLVLWAVGETFGWGPVALRSTSLLLGVLSVPLTAALLHLLTRDRLASLVAAALLALEQVHVTFSRQALQETWTTFFILLGTTAAVLAARRQAPAWLAAAGVAFGLGLSSKLHALLPLVACGAAGLVVARGRRSPALAAWVVACLVALPATVYLATYVPWFARGYGLDDWFRMQRFVLGTMAAHAGSPMDQIIDTEPWQWFLRPMGYASFVFTGGRPVVTLSLSNPVVWLLVIPASAYLARAVRRAPSTAGGEAFVLSLFAASYLPLALSPRPIWLLSSLAVLPFAFMIVGLAASRLLAARPATRPLLVGWGALVVASSLALHPLAIGGAELHGPFGAIVERFRPPEEPEAVSR